MGLHRQWIPGKAPADMITPHVICDHGGGAFFVAYCRRCHAGLCTKMDIGTVCLDGRTNNVILVEPCDCSNPGEIPPQYLPALEIQ